MNIDDSTSIYFFAVILSLAIIIIYYKYRQRTNLLTGGIKVTGIVFELATEAGDMDMPEITVPIIRFLTLENKWITGKTQGIHSTISMYKEGDEVYVYYNSQNPEEFIIEHK